MPGQGDREERLAGLLNMMLRMCCAAILMGFVTLIVRGAIAQTPNTLLQGAAAATVVGAVTVLLFVRRWSLVQLQLLAVVVFATVAMYLASSAYSLGIADLSLAPGAAAAGWNATLSRFALLMFAYGVFIPNKPLRAAPVVIAIASVPLLVAALARARHPELRTAFDTVMGDRAFHTALVLGASAALAILAAFVIDTLFSMAYESRRATFYDLEERIGSGGMGEIWKASHRGLTRPAAVKLIREDSIAGVDRKAALGVLQRFEREAKATAMLRSPHTIEVFDAGITADGHFYYAMEYLDGFDLEDLVTRFGPLPAERVIHLLLQACDSLADAHQHGLVHRDVKPANVYVSRRGPSGDYIKVLDFGLVTTVRLTDARLPVEGVVAGTPAYMAPEVALQKAIDGRADIYALGCVAYWLLTGTQVFEGKSNVAAIVEHVGTTPVPPSQRTELEVPRELDAIVMRCLEKEPEKRFQSAGELAEALAAVPISKPWDARRAAEWWSLHFPRAAAA